MGLDALLQLGGAAAIASLILYRARYQRVRRVSSTAAASSLRSVPAGPAAVGALRPSDREQWESLYRGYIEFYQRSEPQSFYDHNWARLMLEDGAVHALVARSAADETVLLGLVHFMRHASMSGDVCYMQDLFTLPAARGTGVGTRLIKAVVSWCRTAEGRINKVYWNTHHSNPARKLYDRVGTHKGFLKYETAVPG